MAELKTRPTDEGAVGALTGEVTGEEPRVWADAIPVSGVDSGVLRGPVEASTRSTVGEP